MRPLLETQFVSVLFDEARSLLIYKRHKARFGSADEVQRSLAEVLDSADTLRDWPRALLMDFRDGPLRSDDAFEAALSPLLPRLEVFYKRFSRRATLTRTAVGRLQMERLRRESTLVRSDGAFHDEEEALRFLLRDEP